MENIFTYVTKSIDSETSFLYDRREVVTAPMWSTNTSSLKSIFTSSNQHHHQRIYYMDVYSNSTRTSSLDVEFSLAYGHYDGLGSSTGSHGFIITSQSIENKVSESRAIYSQYKNYLLDLDNAKYVEDGKFKFYGLSSPIVGNYIWGKEYWYPFLPPFAYPTKINVPGIVSSEMSLAKVISIGRTIISDPNSALIAFITNSNELFIMLPLFSSFWNANSVFKLGNDKDWKSVSVGHGHVLALKNDGSLWVLGENQFGQLGLGYNEGSILWTDNNALVRVGSDTWKYVCAGAACSFGIKTDGTLWAWGHNSQGQLGLGDYTSRNVPTQVTSYGIDDWDMIATSNAENYYEYQTVMGIQTDGTLWGWGDNNSGVIAIGNPDTTIPYQLGVDTDWEKVSVGTAFAVGIKGGALKSWGANDENGTLGIGSNSPASFPFNFGLQTPSSDTDWNDISCGPNFVLGIKGNALYGWGNNNFNQLAMPIGNFDALSPIVVNNKLGWDKVETAPFMSIGTISSANQNPVKSIVSDDIYSISLSRWNFRDRIDAGSWQLSLCAVNTNNEPDTSKIITLIDETVDYIGTSNSNPTYKLHSLGGIAYGIYSGSLDKGIDINADKEPYGLFFPDNGVILLNGEMLYASASIETRRTEATSSGAFHYSSNAEMIFTSISGAMSVDKSFIANTSEVKIPTYCFIRIHNYEYNHTTNPSYFDVIDDGKDSLVVKDKIKVSNAPFVYITTIGLYNDTGDLLAVAKLSKPIKKTEADELVIKIKLEI